MADSINPPIEIPCVKFPKVPALTIRLPFGAELKSVMDISKGPPSDCTLVHSLMLQLAPTLAGMECFFKMLKVFKALADVKTPPDILDVAKAAADLGTCLTLFANIPLMIADILRMIIAFLRCVIQAIKSIVNFQAGIDLNAAEGNPVLLSSLECAKENGETSMAQLMEALGAVQPLLDMVSPLMELGGLSLTLPSMGDITGAKDVTETLESLEATLTQLQEVLDSIGL